MHTGLPTPWIGRTLTVTIYLVYQQRAKRHPHLENELYLFTFIKKRLLAKSKSGFGKLRRSHKLIVKERPVLPQKQLKQKNCQLYEIFSQSQQNFTYYLENSKRFNKTLRISLYYKFRPTGNNDAIMKIM